MKKENEGKLEVNENSSVRIVLIDWVKNNLSELSDKGLRKVVHQIKHSTFDNGLKDI